MVGVEHALNPNKNKQSMEISIKYKTLELNFKGWKTSKNQSLLGLSSRKLFSIKCLAAGAN